MRTLKPDLCVIGGGSGGLTVAAGAAQLGARTVLIERAKMGGDCLNYGCVPSKALLAAADAADEGRRGARFGIDFGPPAISGSGVHAHVAGTIAAIAPHDSVERFEGLGVTVLKTSARFIDADTVEADGIRVKARRFVVATGSTPAIPPIPGLDRVPYLTNETIFDRTEVPPRLIILGGGPIGIEMAQAHVRLGSRVTVLEMASLLPRDDPELVAVVRLRLCDEGVDLRESVRVVQVAAEGAEIVVTIDTQGQPHRISGSHLLIAAGRRPTLDGLGLERAGIAVGVDGITVDRRLRTTNRRVFAIGDVVGGYRFTHVAAYHASVVIRNALFRLPAKADHRAVPWVTYTDPELAYVGLTEAAARERFGDGGIRVLRAAYADNDRAQAERRTEGLAKVITTGRGRILGAGIVGASAGELIQTWVLAMQRGLGIGSIAALIAPYPTLGEINKRLAGNYYSPTLFSGRTRRLVRLLLRLP
jgi:pyruvate/2-oxoglutarate dehydrogenase complex dihydrolipoamide dehydrogenase (E3) component